MGSEPPARDSNKGDRSDHKSKCRLVSAHSFCTQTTLQEAKQLRSCSSAHAAKKQVSCSTQPRRMGHSQCCMAGKMASKNGEEIIRALTKPAGWGQTKTRATEMIQMPKG